MTATRTFHDWRDHGTLHNVQHHEHGGCVAEQDLKVPIEFRPDGRWHIGTSLHDAGPVEVCDEDEGPYVLCGWSDECGEVAPRAAAVQVPTGPELGVMLLRAYVHRGEGWEFWTDSTVRQLRGLLDLARAMPESLLTRQVRALFGDLDDTPWKAAPLPLSNLGAKRALTAQQITPRDPAKPDEDTPGANEPGTVTVTPGEMTPGMWIMAPDATDPFGGRKIPRQVRRAYAEEQPGTTGRWMIEFSGEYVYPVSLITAEDHEYRVAAPTPDRTALAARYLTADGENITDQPAPSQAAAMIHISERSGEALAMLDLDPSFEFQRVWRLLPGFADVPADWYAQRWTNAEAAILWVWDEVQSLTR